MRYILYSLLFIAVAGSSCQKKVLDIEPEDLLSSDLAFSTPEKIEATVIASYDGLQSKDLLGGRALVYVDVLAEDIFDRIGFFTELPRFNMLSNNSLVAGVWTAGYDAIARANRSIAGITANSSKLSDTKAKELIAECKFVRAVANFYLVNFFGQPYNFTADASHPGIPLITKSYTYNDPDANKPRSGVGEVYTAIINDLNEALAGLPLTYTGFTNNAYHNKTRGTKTSASAFLSRVYLYKGDYANAKKYALDVINNTYSTVDLNPAVNGAFGPGNYLTRESIWSIPNNNSDNPTTNYTLFQHYSGSARGDLPVSNTFLNVSTNEYFTVDDKRRLMIINGTGGNNAFKFTSKFSNLADWAPIIRYPEVLLTYAEAQARLATGVDADAINKLNIVRDRAKGALTPSYTVLSFSDKDKLIAAILGERRIELAFEGHRFWDLMRIKANVTNKFNSDGTSLMPMQPFGAQKNIFPIPQLEVDKSKKVLEQNDGY